MEFYSISMLQKKDIDSLLRLCEESSENLLHLLNQQQRVKHQPMVELLYRCFLGLYQVVAYSECEYEFTDAQKQRRGLLYRVKAGMHQRLASNRALCNTELEFKDDLPF